MVTRLESIIRLLLFLAAVLLCALGISFGIDILVAVALVQALGALSVSVGITSIDDEQVFEELATGLNCGGASNSIPAASGTSSPLRIRGVLRATAQWSAWIVCVGVSVLLLVFGMTGPHASGPLFPFAVFPALAGSLWFILGRIVRAGAFGGASDQHIQRLAATAAVLREQLTAALIGAGALCTNEVQPLLVTCLTSVLLAYTAAMGTEVILGQLVQLLMGGTSVIFAPERSRVREMLFSTGNSPEVSGTFTTIVAWRTVIGVTLSVLLMCAWLLSGVVIVRPHELGVYFRLGRLSPFPLQPGIHLTLPAPFASVVCVPVKQIQAATVGFVGNVQEIANVPFLWTKPHGGEEYPLIVGNGTEAIAVNVIVRFKIGESIEHLCEYVTLSARPEKLLASLALRTVTSETRAATGEELLSTSRNELRKRLEEGLRNSVRQHALGLEILSVEVLSVHPPVEVAASYLEIVNARVDNAKEMTAAHGAADVELLRCQMMGRTNVADAQATVDDRLVSITDETIKSNLLGGVYTRFPDVVRQRYRCETLADAAEGKPLIYIDRSVPADAQLWFEQGTGQKAESR